MALRYSGSNVGVVLLLYCFHAVSFPSHGRKPTQPKLCTSLGPAAPRRDGVHERVVVYRRASTLCPQKLLDAAAESVDELFDRRGAI